MDFSLNSTQIDVCRSIKKISEKVNQQVFARDHRGIFPQKEWELFGELGVHGLPIPEQYGGLGQDMLTTALAVEALGYSCKDEGLVFSICAHLATCAVPVWQWGSEEQKIKYLPGLSKGEIIGGNGISEANAGSDCFSMQTTVSMHNGSFLINGAKIFVTNGPVSDLLIIYAKHLGGLNSLNISSFIIERQSDGVKLGQFFEKSGLRTSLACEIILDSCMVAPSNLLGRERLGMLVFKTAMLWERIMMSAYHVGAMQQQYETALAYANTREQFGQKIIKHQPVSDMLIEMKMKVDTSRLFLYNVCWKFDRGEADLSDASMLKLLTSESKVANSLKAVQVFGAYGYMRENEVEKQLRDSIGATIYSGTSEMQRKIIAESLGD